MPAEVGLFDADDAATPLTPEERAGLIPTWITLRHELNAAEQANILTAQAALFGRRGRLDPMKLADQDYIAKLHARMYGDVWRWAGEYRRSDRNIGVDWHSIPLEMRNLIDDARAWLEFGTFPADELAVRFHHRLVWVHPFPNGNGRISRLMGDLLVTALGGERFTWGSANLVDAGETRRRYVEALRLADRHDIGPLLAFSRS